MEAHCFLSQAEVAKGTAFAARARTVKAHRRAAYLSGSSYSSLLYARAVQTADFYRLPSALFSEKGCDKQTIYFSRIQLPS